MVLIAVYALHIGHPSFINDSTTVKEAETPEMVVGEAKA